MREDSTWIIYERHVITTNFMFLLSLALDVNFSTLEMLRAFKYSESASTANLGDIEGLLTDKALGEPDLRSFFSAHLVGEMLKMGESGNHASRKFYHNLRSLYEPIDTLMTPSDVMNEPMMVPMFMNLPRNTYMETLQCISLIGMAGK
jgi:hypothetical protein